MFSCLLLQQVQTLRRYSNRAWYRWRWSMYTALGKDHRGNRPLLAPPMDLYGKERIERAIPADVGSLLPYFGYDYHSQSKCCWCSSKTKIIHLLYSSSDKRSKMFSFFTLPYTYCVMVCISWAKNEESKWMMSVGCAMEWVRAPKNFLYVTTIVQELQSQGVRYGGCHHRKHPHVTSCSVIRKAKRSTKAISSLNNSSDTRNGSSYEVFYSKVGIHAKECVCP